MKVLIATPYIYKQDWPEFTRNRTGFGIMVNDIFESISKDLDVYLLSHVITEGHEKVLRHTWGNVFGGAKIKDWGKGFKYFFRYNQGIKGRIRYFYYALNSGSVRKTIKTINPDVVHIQGIGIQTKPFIDVCEEEGIPYIVTLHGLIGLDKTINAAAWDKKLEKEFLIEADRKNIPVTVISTGMKSRIENSYLHHEAKNIAVICNGTRIPYIEDLINVDKIDLCKKYHLTDEKIIVVIGSVCDRKNQIQIVRAIGKVKTPCRVFLCGADASHGGVQDEIDRNGLSNRIHILGFLPSEKVEQVLKQSDLNLVASKDEGYGLSIIEAYGQGVPTVTYADLDAVPDLYDERSMIKVEERSDEALAEGIEKGLNKQWNRAWIKEYAKGFSLDVFAEQYKLEYQQVLNRSGYMSIAKTCDYLAIQRKLGYKVISYVGNITDNKNQIELVRQMPKMMGMKVLAVLAGREVDNRNVRNFINYNRLSDIVILTGFCSEMDSVWSNVDLNVFLSKNDGFGLSIIEGYMRGVPSLMYDDLDAVADVKSDELFLITRNDRQLTTAIVSILDSINNSNIRISNLDSAKYSMNQMRRKYIAEYEKILSV